MTTGLFTHPASHGHHQPAGHAEQLARIVAVEAALADPRFDGLIRRQSPAATRTDLERAHPAAHLDALQAAIPQEGLVWLDPDTHAGPGTWEAALHAAGGACAAVDAVVAGEMRRAFVAARPPGHHAETTRAMGFCLFANVAIAAKRALDHHRLGRVAVVDFDVHHGNGTQEVLWSEGRALFVSSHQMPLYPGTGAAEERGAQGTVLNLPLQAGSGGAAMRAAYVSQVFPAIETFAPDLIVISAGFDAHEDDPLGGLGWRTEDFHWLTARICNLADRFCGGRVVSCLEGGYNLTALGASVAAHLNALQGRAP